jgi:WD40 repeat protein
MTADGGAIKVAWVPEAPHVLAVATTAGSVQLWDSRDGSVRQSLTGHTGMVLDVAFAPKGEVVTAGDDGTARVFALTLA